MSSLRHVPLSPILAGEPPDLSPTVLHTTAGQALFYPGINNLLGEPSLGKTLIAERAAAEVLAGGGSVLMVDWEDTAATFVERMRALGVADDQLDRVMYFNVEGALDDDDRGLLLTLVEGMQIPASLFEEQFDLIVADDLTRAALEHFVTYGKLPDECVSEEAVRVTQAYTALELNEFTIGIPSEIIHEPWLEHVPADRRHQVLVIIDAYAPALAADGANEDNNTEVTTWTNATLRPLARAGAVVLILDHVVKDPNARTRGGRGAGAKLALVDGASYELRPIHAFARSEAGSSKLVIAKDRPGLVGPIGTTAALVHFEPTGDDGLEIRLEPAETATSDAGTFRPTHLMERISKHLERLELIGEPLPTGREIEADVEGKTTALRAGLQVLVEENYVERLKDGKAIRHRSIRDFRTDDHPSASLRPTSVPTTSGTPPKPSASLRPCVTTKTQGRDAVGPDQHTTDQPSASLDHDTADDTFWADLHDRIANDEHAVITDEELLS